MRRSLTRMRYFGKGLEQAKNDIDRIDSPMGTDNDAHIAECHSGLLEVGIVGEVAYPKNLSRLSVDQSERSVYHSTRIDEHRNLSPRRKRLAPRMGKRRAKVSGKSIFLKSVIGVSIISYSHVKERKILHLVAKFHQEKL